MRNLLALLYRSRIFLLFILLEVLAFVWISASRSFQRAALANSANEVTGTILQRTNEIEDYLDLKEQNQRLAQENAQLRSQSSTAYFPLSVPLLSRTDSTYMVRYTFREGEVISSSYNKARNFMTLNRGSDHGIASGQGVIGSNGIVGIVKDVSPHFSTVIPIINPSFSVSGRIRNSGFFGPVQWKNSDYRYAYLTDIPRYAKVKAGDTVITDARSLIFPAGIVIGYIESYELQEDQNFFQVKLKLATDYASLEHVYIVEDKMKLEVEQLQNQQTN